MGASIASRYVHKFGNKGHNENIIVLLPMSEFQN